MVVYLFIIIERVGWTGQATTLDSTHLIILDWTRLDPDAKALARWATKGEGSVSSQSILNFGNLFHFISATWWHLQKSICQFIICFKVCDNY